MADVLTDADIAKLDAAPKPLTDADIAAHDSGQQKSGFFGRLGENGQGLGHAVMHPLDTAKRMLTPDPTVAKEAADAFNAGHYGRAAGSLIEDIPIIGPQIRRTEQDLRNQDPGAIAADALTVAALGKAPGLLKKVPGVARATEVVGNVARDPLGMQRIDPAARAATMDRMGMPDEPAPPAPTGQSLPRRLMEGYRLAKELKSAPRRAVESLADRAIDLYEGKPGGPQAPAPPPPPPEALKPTAPPTAPRPNGAPLPDAALRRARPNPAPPIGPDHMMPPPADVAPPAFSQPEGFTAPGSQMPAMPEAHLKPPPLALQMPPMPETPAAAEEIPVRRTPTDDTLSTHGNQPTAAEGTAGEGGAVPGPLQSGPPDPTETRVRVPGQERSYAARYQVRELADVQPSHNGVSFQPNPRYQLRNDRNYSRAENQGKVVSGALPNQFEPSYHITDNPDATNGPVVIDSEGNALGGNGRTMILQRVYQSNPKGAAAYRDLLTRKAAQFGLDPEAIGKMKQPVLVREIADSEFADPQGKQVAVTDFNKKGTAELRQSERTIADSRRVSPGTLDHISARLDAEGPDATLSKVLQGKGGTEVLNKLIDDGVISPQERAAFADGDALTKDGSARISKLLLGRFFRDPAQLDAIPPVIKNKLERIAAPLAKAEGSEGWGLTSTVQDAIDLLEEARAHGSSNIDQFLKQSGLFGDQRYSPKAVTVAKALRSTNTKQLTEAVRRYAEDASFAEQGPGLFGDQPAPEKSFADAFGPKRGPAVESSSFMPPMPEAAPLQGAPPAFEHAYQSPENPQPNYTAPKEHYQNAARTVKGRAIARLLRDSNVSAEKASTWKLGGPELAKAAKSAGVNAPTSAESLAVVLDELRKMPARDVPEFAKGGVVAPKKKPRGRFSRRGIWYGPRSAMPPEPRK